MPDSPSTLVLIGPPGSGKSTQAELLCKRFGCIHIDMGAELRAAAEEDSALGRQVNEIINEKQELVPDAIIADVLERALARLQPEAGALLDGAPRNLSQIEEVVAVLNRFGRPIRAVFFIDIDEEESVKRISKRFLCLGCRKPYILGPDSAAERGICEACGGKVGQRQDDTPEGVRKRFRVFQQETRPVVLHFEAAGLLTRIDGKQGSERIFSDILSHLEPAS